MKSKRKMRKLRKTKKKAHGLLKFLRMLRTGLILNFLGTACGKTHIMTACAGNTCRSPVGEFYIKSILGDNEDVNIFSRGVNVRQMNSTMAPYSNYFAKEICGNNEKCKRGVDEHRSTPFSCEEIMTLIEEPDAILRIIPMDETTSQKIFDALRICNLTQSQRNKIIVGLDCNSGVCKRTSGEVPDPFFQQKTPYEHASYVNMVKSVRAALSNDFERCPYN
jgi:protein-tyrosine-phosphatase